LKGLKQYLIISVLLLSFSTSVYAGQLRMVGGTTLFYTYARIGNSGQSAYTTENASFNVLAFNQTALSFEINTTSGSTSPLLNIEYENGIPVYADYLEYLVYLPPECIAQGMRGNLNWTTQVRTSAPAPVYGWTWQSQNFTVEAGNFEGVNMTLTLIGANGYGALTLIYDLSSGIMIYEQWIPMSGTKIDTSRDIIVLSLTGVVSSPEKLQTVAGLVLALAVFATPAVMLLHGLSKGLQRRHPAKRLGPSNIRAKDGFPGNPFYVIVAGSLLNLASTMLPWSQQARSWVYLPLGLSSTLAGSAALFTSTSTLLAISLIVQASAIVAWIGIALQVYTGNKVAPKVMTIASSVLALLSAIIFIQTGWTASFGPPVIVVAGVLALTGTSLVTMATRKGSRTISSAS
jgi:hypothetical protein